MIWYLDSAHQNSWKTLLFSTPYGFTYQKLISNQLYSSGKMDGSHNKNKYYFMFDDLPLNQKQKWFDIWIKPMKTVEKHSFPVIHMLSQTRK